MYSPRGAPRTTELSTQQYHEVHIPCRGVGSTAPPSPRRRLVSWGNVAYWIEEIHQLA